MRFDDLRDFLPDRAVLLSEESRRAYECDALASHRIMPGCVVLPETVAQA